MPPRRRAFRDVSGKFISTRLDMMGHHFMGGMVWVDRPNPAVFGNGLIARSAVSRDEFNRRAAIGMPRIVQPRPSVWGVNHAAGCIRTERPKG